MKVHLWAFGAPSDEWVSKGEQIYARRIERYLPFEYKPVQVSKASVASQVLSAESKWLRTQLDASASKLIILDETGEDFTSKEFAKNLEQWRQGSHKRLVFLIGSAYGFDESVYGLADKKISISPMTLPHQICRLLFLEQIYRACTILKGESYHHE
ncbi:MAG: 23S rRNA (pseudouridine(1915)-N(3))-methyltransferase RlmH [Bacteroidota bacterium]|nr:23S rRNA (pseudouridine(1915)-N(3))-methyltransferase RlmH [Bacteroidota bacterium]